MLRAYKGARDETIELYDAEAGSDCAFSPLKPGQQYFVYGFEGDDGKIYIQACTRTSGLDFAGADIRTLEASRPPKRTLSQPGKNGDLGSNRISQLREPHCEALFAAPTGAISAMLF
jgi:hypothetical protein